MATTHIRISNEAKERLEARKRPEESYTDVILRLTERDDEVRRFIGKYADVDLEAGIERVKERTDRDTREKREDVRRQ